MFLSFVYIVIGCLIAAAVQGKLSAFGGHLLLNAIWLAIILGGLLIIIGLLIGWAAFMRHLSTLIMANVLLAVTGVTFIGLSAYVYDAYTNAGVDLVDVLKVEMRQYDSRNVTTRLAMDLYQKQLNCCGLWYSFDWLDQPFKAIPTSCPGPNPLLATGCATLIMNYVSQTVDLALHVVGGVSGSFVLGLALITAMCCALHRQSPRGARNYRMVFQRDPSIGSWRSRDTLEYGVAAVMEVP
ncbi:hypothetical protein BV898_11168 [Hypsibius exemplaris]|uniref:Tetraspanin n=1 Tax=Hypsibius exemplaris TaxID=2072580 RepID=A0A1W0WHK1_HYPEX|nr:hypothetical protein BV898_11168 [Hypsibius exemplaris]